MSFIPFTLTNENLNMQRMEVLRILQKSRYEIEKLLEQKEFTYKNFVTPYQLCDQEIGFYFSPISHLNYVNNSKESEKIYNELLPILTEYSTQMGQNKDIYNAFRQIKDNEYDKLDEAQKMVVDNAIKSFELSGVDLPKETKERLQEIDIKLSELTNSFAQNLLKATDAYEMIVDDFEDVKELPNSSLDASKVNIEGKEKFKFTLQQPSFVAFMTYSSNRKLKEKLYKAYTTRAPENETLISEILALRNEKSKILGFNNFAELSLAKKMAESPEEVVSFLEELAEKSKKQASIELKTLQEFANQNGFDGKLEAYDIAYYSEKLKIASLDVADEEYMPYFEKNTTVDGLFTFVNKLLQVSFKEVQTPTWHESVKVYDLYRENNIIGRIYVDLENRKGKRGGAWMDEWITRHIDENENEILPIAYIVANFATATKDTPSLLKPSDVVTLFHELGHAIHHLFSQVVEPHVSGINGVEWDAVEFPSQFLENFAYEAEVLKTFATHYKTKEKITNEMVEKLKISKNFQSAMAMLRQLEFSLFDMKIHQEKHDAKEVENILNEVREKYSVMKTPSYNKFQWGFAHIFAGGYAAGYYSYKWAEVLSADAFFKFIDAGIFDNTLSQAYFNEVLAKGGSRKAMENYIAFSGDRPQSDSLLRLNGIK
jgi:oligopeptidase A